MDKAPTMPLRIGRLIIWFLIGYFLIIRLREITIEGSPADLLIDFEDAHRLGLEISVLFSFFSYCLMQYLLLHFGFDRLKWYILAVGQVAGVLACMFFRAFLEEGLLKAITGTGNYNPDMPWSTYLWDNVYYAIIFCSIGGIFYFYQMARFNEALRRESEVLQRETELKFLRSQINPHFLFNTLNNLYALVNAKSPASLTALEKLSGLLRYSLYEQMENVSLDKEINYLRDFIHLESLRIYNLVAPSIEIGPFTHNWTIPPLLLVPFVENAFKHGELTLPEAPLLLAIAEVEGALQITVRNLLRKHQTSADGVGGIGLTNVRKRLQLLYPNRHALVIAAAEEYFTVKLTIAGPAHDQPQRVTALASCPAFVSSQPVQTTT